MSSNKYKPKHNHKQLPIDTKYKSILKLYDMLNYLGYSEQNITRILEGISSQVDMDELTKAVSENIRVRKYLSGGYLKYEPIEPMEPYEIYSKNLKKSKKKY